ncbi:MAG: helix-turn-helix transcriptional regulator [Deltaproteobacteria bacterium]|nr:helix-turn-helix transcriptional regulator [Deltaproteobacteria bacterium]
MPAIEQLFRQNNSKNFNTHLNQVQPADSEPLNIALKNASLAWQFEWQDESVGVIQMAPLFNDHATDVLTPSERDIAHRVICGDSSAQIATGRNTSVKTVQNQLAVIYRKLHINSRQELIALFK